MPTPSGGTIDCSGRKWTSASSTIPTSVICKIQLAETGRRLWVLDVTSDLGIPTFVTIAHWMEDGQEFVEFGSGAHFDARIAALRAMTELNQFLSIGLMGGRARHAQLSQESSHDRVMTAPRHFGCRTIPI